MADTSTPPARVRRRTWLWLAAAALAALAFYMLYWPEPDGKPQGRGFMMGAPQIPVSVVQAGHGQVDRSLRALGTVVAPATINIRSRVDGPLESLHFSDGQMVNAGDLLAVIDPRPFEIRLEQALGQQKQLQAQLENARLELARFEKLHRQDSIARQQLDAARARLGELQGQARVSQATVDEARLQLDYTRIMAPISGRLGLRRVDVGNMVHASDPDGLVVLTQNNPVDVLYAIPQNSLPALQQARGDNAQLATILLAAADGDPLASGTLVAVDNQIDVATGTVQLKSSFENADGRLFPNQFVQVRLLLGVQSGVVLPLRAIQRGAAGEFVYRIDDGQTAHVVPVLTGADDGDMVIIESGIELGDTVVLEGTDRLREGSSVEIIQATGQ